MGEASTHHQRQPRIHHYFPPEHIPVDRARPNSWAAVGEFGEKLVVVEEWRIIMERVWFCRRMNDAAAGRMIAANYGTSTGEAKMSCGNT